MSGFENDVMVSSNVNFNGTAPKPHLGIITTAGQLLIGTGTTPAIIAGSITSPLGTLTIGYSSPNITLDLTGGASAIEKVALQTGTTPITPLGGVITINGAVVAAGTNPVRTDGTGAHTMAVEVQTSQALAAADATKIGLCNFNSAQFSVAATGFVSIISGGFTWSNKSTSFSAAAENGYFITGSSTATLPASPSIGDTIEFFVQGAFTLTIQANTGQKIQFASNLSSAAGTQVNTATGDACKLVYNSTGLVWNCTSFVGAWNFT